MYRRQLTARTGELQQQLEQTNQRNGQLERVKQKLQQDVDDAQAETERVSSGDSRPSCSN